jgi:hypothetical protein
VKRRRGVDEYKEGSEEEVKVQDVYNETPWFYHTGCLQ